ncbi:TPA: ead/Ea22-like family protein [Klebsiella pneumoniae]|uniref:ead/Ea22-like family protein n=1 Tax=Klebsiella pneumoniae TaxID=573 RepID=UPI001D0DFEAF|nr:ead/Ea22-like family protein [Klebsiella pneumoniae]
MTTDITELAQSLENAASKALIEEGLTWFCEEQLSHEDGIALHKADAEFIALANPTNILALVDALEKAQQKIDELENDEVRQRLANAEHQLYMAELAKHNLKASRKAQFRKRRAAEKRIAELEEAEQKLCAANVTLDARAELAERHLAELESRSITVKLPESFKLAKSSSGLRYYYADEVDAALAAAGIKVEAE